MLRPAGPQITLFDVSATTILEGEAVTATWQAEHGTKAWLDGQSVPLSGAYTFVPAQSGFTKLVVKDEHGQQVEWQQYIEMHDLDHENTLSVQAIPPRRKPQSARPRSQSASDLPAGITIISATPRLDLGLDGTWEGADGHVWYLRQIGDAIWGASFSADQGQTQTAVFQGTQLGEVIQLAMVGIPRGQDLRIKKETMVVDLETQQLIWQTHPESLPKSLIEERLTWTSAKDPLNLGIIKPPSASALTPTVRNLTGIWWANDGGTYYIQQSKRAIWGLGLSADGGQTFTTVFRGTQSGDVVEGKWIDLPKGERDLSGELALQIILSGSVIQLQPASPMKEFLNGVLEPVPTT